MDPMQQLKEDNEKLRQKNKELELQLIPYQLNDEKNVVQFNNTPIQFTPLNLRTPEYDYQGIKTRYDILDWENPFQEKYRDVKVAACYRISRTCGNLKSQRDYTRAFFEQKGIDDFPEFMEVGPGWKPYTERPTLLSFIAFCNTHGSEKVAVFAWESRITRRGICEGITIYNTIRHGIRTINNYDDFSMDQFKWGLYLAWVFHTVNSFVTSFNQEQRDMAINNIFDLVPAGEIVFTLEELGKYDVVFPLLRNKQFNGSLGNQRFLKIIAANYKEYESNRNNSTGSSLLFYIIVKRARVKNNSHVRFLKREGNMFVEMGDQKTKELVRRFLNKMYLS